MKHETTPRFTIKFHTKGWKLDSETSASFQIPANFRLLGETCLQNLLPGFRLS